jgi:hypothetical protein
LLSFRLVGRTTFASTMPTNTVPPMNSFIGKIHLTQDKLMSVEMWYVDATPWCYLIRYADSFVSPGGGSVRPKSGNILICQLVSKIAAALSTNRATVVTRNLPSVALNRGAQLIAKHSPRVLDPHFVGNAGFGQAREYGERGIWPARAARQRRDQARHRGVTVAIERT